MRMALTPGSVTWAKSMTTTSAPASCASRAAAAPMPLAPPTTTTRLPSYRKASNRLTLDLLGTAGSGLRGDPSLAVTRAPQQEALRSPDHEGIDVLDARLAPFAAQQLIEHRLECDARFQPRQCRTEAEVVAEAERQVSLRIARDVELGRGRAPMPFVAVGGAEDRDHMGIGR